MILIDSSRMLKHHGIKGQKWGERHGPPYPLNQNPKKQRKLKKKYLKNSSKQDNTSMAASNLSKARTASLDKWGSSPDTNVCYIAGGAGSGKSTTAKGMASPKDHVIHLDLYFDYYDENDKSIASQLDKGFVDYLKKNVPDFTEISNPDKYDRFSGEWWNTVDRFAEAIQNYGKERFKDGEKVIAEGVQVADGTLRLDAQDYKGKPFVALNGNVEKILANRLSRGDDFSISAFMEEFYDKNKQIQDLANELNAGKNSKFVADFLNKYGKRKIIF